MEKTIRVGISTCLLGENVRYDGGHKLDRYLMDTLGQYVDYVPVCPEVECGLGVPREAIRLVGDPESPRLVTVKTGHDLTERMLAWAGKRVKELEREGLCGFIPLIVPVTLINHYARKYREEYLLQQVYLNPHPIALQLRNHA